MPPKTKKKAEFRNMKAKFRNLNLKLSNSRFLNYRINTRKLLIKENLAKWKNTKLKLKISKNKTKNFKN